MPSEKFKNIPIGHVHELIAGIDTDKVQYQQKNIDDQYITTITKGGRIRHKKKKIKGHKPNSSYLVRLNLPDVSEMPTIRPFTDNEDWCPIPSIFCRKTLCSVTGINQDVVEILVRNLPDILDSLLMKEDYWKKLLSVIQRLNDIDDIPFTWNPFPKIPLVHKYSFYWLLVFRVSILDYLSKILNRIGYIKTNDHSQMVDNISNTYIRNTPESVSNQDSNIFFRTHEKTDETIENIVHIVLGVNFHSLFAFSNEDRQIEHSVYDDNGNIQLWRLRELEYNTILLLHTHIPVIINIGKLLQYEIDKQNESSLVKLNYLPIDYSKYIIYWLESNDLTQIAVNEWYSEKSLIHEGSLYDITSFMMKTKICGDQDSDKIRIVKLLNKIMPIKCMSRNLGSILSKSVTYNPTIFHVIHTMIQCTVLGLYRRTQVTRYSLATRLKLFRDYVMNNMTTPAVFKELYGKETNPRFPLVKFAMKENVVFMAKLITGLRDKLESEFNTIWRRFEGIVNENIEKMRISIELCGTSRDFLTFIHNLFEEQMVQQKDIIYRPHKRDLITVIVTTMDSILLEYYADILLKKVVGVRPSKTIIGSIGVDIESDSMFNPTVDQIYGLDRLSDVYKDIDKTFEDFTHVNVVSVTSLDQFGISNKTIQKLALMISEYEVQPMETQVERTLKSILYDHIRARIDFPEKEFLIIRKFFHVMHYIVSVRPINLPKHYRDNQIIALKQRYRIYSPENCLDSKDIDHTIGSILYCSNCNSIRSPITTDVNNNFNDYGNSMEITDILNTPKKERNILCYCRPRTNVKLLEQKLYKTNNTIQDAFVNCNKDNIIKKFDLQNAGDFDDLGNMTDVGIVKKNEKKEKNRGKHVTVNPIEHLFKTKASIELSIWKHRRCSKTPIKRIPIIGKILFINGHMYMICPRCGVYTIYAAERLKGGFVTCGVCDKMITDNLIRRVVSNNDSITVNTRSFMSKLTVLNIDKSDPSAINDDIMMDVYNNRIKCVYDCKYNNNVVGWSLLQVINDDDGDRLGSIDFTKTYEYNDQVLPIMNIYTCKKHSTHFVQKYCDVIHELHEFNIDNCPLPLLSIVLQSIDDQWTTCEIGNEEVDLTLDTKLDNVDGNGVIIYGPIKIHTKIEEIDDSNSKKRGRKPKLLLE